MLARLGLAHGLEDDIVHKHRQHRCYREHTTDDRAKLDNKMKEGFAGLFNLNMYGA